MTFSLIVRRDEDHPSERIIIERHHDLYELIACATEIAREKGWFGEESWEVMDDVSLIGGRLRVVLYNREDK